jgi:hypothetical protein
MEVRGGEMRKENSRDGSGVPPRSQEDSLSISKDHHPLLQADGRNESFPVRGKELEHRPSHDTRMYTMSRVSALGG